MKYKSSPALILLMIAALACGLNTPSDDQPGVETTVAATMQALTQSAPSEGVQFDSPPLSGTLPYGLGTGVADEVTADMEFPICANPSCGDTPSHHRYIIQNYQYTGSVHSPRILVFNAAEFASFTDFNPQTIADLQSLKDRPDRIPDGLVNRGFDPRFMTFQNGYGVGSLADPLQGPAPITNAGLFYYFEGLTDDGQYYVSAILPTSAPFLVADDNPASPLPDGAVPFGWENPGDFDLVKYYETVTQQLNAATPETFFPNLNNIQALIQSLLVR